MGVFFNKFADLRSATLLKNRLLHRCFPVNFPKFVRTLVLQNTSRWLLLVNIPLVNIRQSWHTKLEQYNTRTLQFYVKFTSFHIMSSQSPRKLFQSKSNTSNRYYMMLYLKLILQNLKYFIYVKTVSGMTNQ